MVCNRRLGGSSMDSTAAHDNTPTIVYRNDTSHNHSKANISNCCTINCRSRNNSILTIQNTNNINNNNSNVNNNIISYNSKHNYGNGNGHSNCNSLPIAALNTNARMAASQTELIPFFSSNLFQILCLIGITFLSYYNATRCALVFDDISAIRDNKDIRPNTPWYQLFYNDFWGTPIRKEHSHKSYRPLTVLTFRLNYWLHELHPYGYHFTNLVLHLAVCFLWRRVCRLVLMQCTMSAILSQRCAFVSSLLFAVHPIHTEAVTGVVGRAELLSSLFYLCAFLCYSSAVSRRVHSFSSVGRQTVKSLRSKWLMSWGGFAGCLLVSMLCKEQGITIAGICILYELFIVQQMHPLQLWYCALNLFEDRLNRSGDNGANSSSQSTNNSNSSSSSNSNSSGSNHSSPANKINHKRLSNGLPVINSMQVKMSNWPSVSLHLPHKSIEWSSILLKRIAYVIFTTVVLMAGRVYIMGLQLPVFTRFDNPAAVAETPVRQLTFGYLIYLNLSLLLLPHNLCCDWTMGTIPLIQGLLDPRNLLTLLAFGFLALLVVCACVTRSRQQSNILLMCLAWLLMPFIPASNLFFPVGFVVAERILYMPSMGFCLLVAYGLEQMRQKFSGFSLSISQFLYISLLLSHTVRTHWRNLDWQNEYTLFMSGIHVNDRNAKLFNNVGHALEYEGRFSEALIYFQQAVAIQPDDIGAHINVGRAFNNLKMFDKAEEAYLKAKSLFPRIKSGESYQARIAPNHLNVFINLANLIARNQSRLEEADMLYRQAISMRADYVQAYINRGDILMKLNRSSQAQEMYEKALLYDSENADIYYNLGVVFLEQGKGVQAQVYFNKALELDHKHEQALLNSAILLQEIGGTEARQLSRERLHKVVLRNSDNEKAYFNLGMLAMDEGDFSTAEQYFKRSIHLKSDFRSALFNLALLLADTNRPLDAIPFLNELIRFHPNHIKGLILLGDVYINHMKDLDAAEVCYRSIIKIEPHNIQGLHNLCVVFVERKHLFKARLCLRYVHHLAPNEDYILRHLQIVEKRLQQINKLVDSAPEKQLAYTDFDPHEFPLPTASLIINEIH